MNELINIAVVKLLEHWDILTSCGAEGGAYKFMDVYKAPCMKWDGTLGTNGINATLIPCTQEGCCVSRYIATRQAINGM